MDLKSKTVLITGASSGLGEQLAYALAKEGANLALLARDHDKLTDISSECQSLGSPVAIAVECDVTDKESREVAYAKVTNAFLNVHVLINNAGVWHKRDDLEDIDDEDIESVIDTNLTGLIMMTKLFLPNLKEEDEAAVVNISSRSGVGAPEGQSVYSASKWGVRGFTEVLHEDLKGTNVRVAGVYQGGTRTELFKKAGERMNTKKYTEPEDLADVIRYMLNLPEKIWMNEVRVEY